MIRVLLTAFEPFGGETVNASREAARILVDRGVPGIGFTYRELPVARTEATDLLVAGLDEAAPDAAVLLGEAGGRARVTPERVAVNLDDYRIADNRGEQPRGEPVVPGGPAAYFSTLPVRAMAERMVAAGVPAAVSNSAGTYLCNRVFYVALHWAAAHRSGMPAGFVHVPHLPGQAAGKGGDHPCLAAETTAVGLAAALGALVPAPPA